MEHGQAWRAQEGTFVVEQLFIKAGCYKVITFTKAEESFLSNCDYALIFYSIIVLMAK